MIFDLLQDKHEPLVQLDVCIVGAGAAGITLAVELARSGQSVYLLEGGGSSIEAATQEPYRSVAAGLKHRGVHDGRFRVQGGTTTKWGGQILELDEVDFKRRAWIEGSGWPFPKSTLAPFYRRALQHEGVDGALESDDEVWDRIGVGQPCFEGLQSYLSRWCPEPNFSVRSRAALEGQGIQVWLHTNAVALLLQDEAVTGVRARTQDGRTTTFRARRYVFCMGAIESSRFFLQPRAGGLPWNASGLLGRHFQDHIDCNIGTIEPHSRSTLHRCFDSIFWKGFKYQPKVKLPIDKQQEAGALNVAGTLAFDSATAETMTAMRATAKNLLRGKLESVKAADVSRMLCHSSALLRQAYRYAFECRSFQPADATISVRVHCEQEPCSMSSITLAGERDSLGLQRTKLSWKIAPRELKTIRYFASVAVQAFRDLGKLTLSDACKDDDALTASCEDSFHHMGGMRMDSCPSQGVVDTDLKLHGVSNVYICSSAVFPTSGFSNPTHTLLALAVRLADHLSA